MTEYRDCAICGSATEQENLATAVTALGQLDLCVHCLLAYRIGRASVHVPEPGRYVIPDPPCSVGDMIMTSYKITAIRSSTTHKVHEIDFEDVRIGERVRGTCVIPYSLEERGMWLLQSQISNEAKKQELARMKGAQE